MLVKLRNYCKFLCNVDCAFFFCHPGNSHKAVTRQSRNEFSTFPPQSPLTPSDTAAYGQTVASAMRPMRMQLNHGRSHRIQRSWRRRKVGTCKRRNRLPFPLPTPKKNLEKKKINPPELEL